MSVIGTRQHSEITADKPAREMPIAKKQAAVGAEAAVGAGAALERHPSGPAVAEA